MTTNNNYKFEVHDTATNVITNKKPINFFISILFTLIEIITNYDQLYNTLRKTKRYNSTNNDYKFEVHDTATIINYVVHIRANKYGCNDEFRKINISKPRYNDLSEIAICKT